jgi:HK97 family phage major capsid protein
VPTVQANEIIEILSLGGVARKSGVRIWGLEGIQKLVAPTATAFPTVEFLGQNTSQTATDPNLGQVSFDLKTRRALVAIPNELLVSSTPAYDRLLAELLGEAFAEHEDSIFFDSTAASGGPTPFYAASGTTTHLVGESANGGNLAYTDLLRTLRKSAEAKAKGSLAWYCSPRTFFDRILGLLDGNSRPVVTQDAVGPVPYKLFGWPVFVTPAVPNDLTNGSGSSQSYLMLANPKYLHIAQSGGIEIATSTEAAFATNQTLVRIAQGLDFAVAPAAGVTILKGVN